MPGGGGSDDGGGKDGWVEVRVVLVVLVVVVVVSFALMLVRWGWCVGWCSSGCSGGGKVRKRGRRLVNMMSKKAAIEWLERWTEIEEISKSREKKKCT